MLEKVISEDKIEIVGEFKAGQDYSNESPEVQAICAAIHTPEVIAAYQASQETE